MNSGTILIKKSKITESGQHTQIEIPVCYAETEKLIRIDSIVPMDDFAPGYIGDVSVALAFVFAMQNSLDIVCEMPVSDELMYQINDYLSPVLSRTGKLKQIVLEVPENNIECCKITGNRDVIEKNCTALDLSYGRYGMYTLQKHINNPEYSKLDYVIMKMGSNLSADLLKHINDHEIKTVFADNNASDVFAYSGSTAMLCSSLAYAFLFSNIAGHYCIPAETYIDDYYVDIGNLQRSELMMAECFSTSRVSIVIADLEIFRTYDA